MVVVRGRFVRGQAQRDAQLGGRSVAQGRVLRHSALQNLAHGRRHLRLHKVGRAQRVRLFLDGCGGARQRVRGAHARQE
jgi:hypothetical protein